MEILLLLIVVVIVFAVLKTRVFSSEEEKCFRRIWAMKKSGLFDEEHATYDRLFKKFDIDFNSSVSNQNLNTLINAAHLFDGTKNQRNLGVWVGRVVEEKIKMKMYEHGKAAQYDDLIAKNMAKGAELIDNNLTEFNQESCVEHLREISKDNTELDLKKTLSPNVLF